MRRVVGRSNEGLLAAEGRNRSMSGDDGPAPLFHVPLSDVAEKRSRSRCSRKMGRRDIGVMRRSRRTKVNNGGRQEG